MQKLGQYLLKDEMPIWLSILFALAAGVGTYFIAPLINQEIEYQNNRSQHVSTTVSELNSKVVDLSKGVRRFNESLFYERRDTSEERHVVLDKIVELQWVLIDVDTIIARENSDSRSVEALQNNLDLLYEEVQNAGDPADQENVIKAMAETARGAQSVIVDLYSAAKLA